MATPLKVLLVDDEPPARRWLKTLLAPYPDIVLISEAGTLPEAVCLWEAEKPDVIFLDVQMPPANGFDLLPLLHPLPRIVFVTAHDTYAVRAFEANALDYLLKPVDPDRLAETLRRVRSAPAPPPPPASGSLQPDDLVPLRDGGFQRIVPVRDIALIEAEGAYTKIRLRGHSPMILLRRLREWEAMLPAPPFFRIDRSTIMNLTLVRKVHRIDRDETHLELEQAGALSLNRIAARRLRKLLRTASL